jgi:hypothetical protein
MTASLQTSGQAEALAVQRTKDEKMASLLGAIRVYLPSLQRKGGGQTSDYLVHPTALAHLRRRFNYVGSALLRNDSLTDMSDRAVLYFELFEWLEVRCPCCSVAMRIAGIFADNIESRGTGKHDGNAYHGPCFSEANGI